MNVDITPTAEALLEQLIALGQGSPEVVIEQALQTFCTNSKRSIRLWGFLSWLRRRSLRRMNSVGRLFRKILQLEFLKRMSRLD
jgi:hypothetical protein